MYRPIFLLEPLSIMFILCVRKQQRFVVVLFCFVCFCFFLFFFVVVFFFFGGGGGSWGLGLMF